MATEDLGSSSMARVSGAIGNESEPTTPCYDKLPAEAAIKSPYVVGIGASAGGLKPLQEFFGAMPQDSGLAFVIVQHLSPEFKSLMSELLSRHTSMALHRVEHGMLLEPDSIYLIPPKKNVSISDDKLLLSDQDLSRGHPVNFPIDIFFNSLAESIGERAIGVVLSGTGSDGTRGVRTINEAGGVVLVQDPETAEFDGMPRSVMGTGMADYVLRPRELARAIYDYVTSAPGGLIRTAASDGLDTTLQNITAIVARDQRIDFSHYKLSTLGRRIERRRVIAGCDNLDQYIRLLEDSSEERAALRNDLLINVTSFFRDTQAWAYLEQQIIPRLIAQTKESDELRIWVTACSSGEEAYSLAMLVQEGLEAAGKSMDVKIFATDIDDAALAKAGAGMYSESIMEDISPQMVARFFKKKGKGYQVVRGLREMLIFAQQNLARDPPFTRMHLVTCRNLLIYMQPKLQQQVLSTLHFALQAKGILFLGAAESVGELESEFNTLNQKWKIFEKRRDVKLPMRGGEGLVVRALHSPRIANDTADTVLSRRLEAMASEAFGECLREQNAFCLLATSDHELLQVFGDSRKFLSIPEGKVPMDVTKLVPRPLSLPLSTALHRARMEKKPVAYSGMKVDQDSDTRTVDMHVSYHAGGNAWPEFLMVLFKDAGPAVTMSTDQYDVDSQAAQRIADLENDLQQTKENLQATIEELETTNEEQQATNQEMLASNEELQSTNEELQSVNEELYSVNAEYQSKIQELTDLNNDMDNLLSSTNIGTVFLDNDLQIRKFTPAVTDVIKLQDHDIGRPIDQISYGIDMDHDELLAQIQQVLQTEEHREFNVESRNGVSLLLRVNPYRDEANRTDGVVLTLVDVSELKRAENALRRSEEQVRGIINVALDGVITMSDQGMVTGWNPQAEQMFGWSREQAVGQKLSQLVIPQSQREAHRKGLQNYLDTGESGLLNRRVELEAIRKNGKPFPVELAVVPLNSDDRLEFCGYVRDITDRKRNEESRARLAAIVQSSHDAIIGKTIKGTITAWNTGAERMYGYTAEEAIGQPVSMLLPPDRPQEVAELIEQLKQGKPIEDFETVRQTKDGRHIDVALTISPIVGRNGRIVGAATIARDITERKRMEIKLRLLQSVTQAISTSRDFESAMENALVLICEAIGWDYGEAWIPSDDHTVLHRCAGAFMKSAALDPFARASSKLSLKIDEGLPGTVWSSREPAWFLDVSSKPPQEFLRAKAAAAVGLKGGFAVPIVDDDKFLAVLSSFMMSLPRENDLALVIDLVNSVASQLGSVVARKQIDAQLQLALAELEQKNREMEEFVYTVSHDLKSPLVTLGGMLGILKEELQQERIEDAGEVIDTAENTVESMCDTIADLLKLSQLGRDACEAGPFSFIASAREVLGRHSAQLKTQRVTVDLEADDVILVADRNRLAEVLDNLITNALKYACDGPNSRIEMGAQSMGQEIHLFVKDNGPGIAKADQERIFGLFQRLDTDQDGSGVGLAIVQRIMEVHGGRVWVESEVGAGATFWLAFPSGVREPVASC